MSDISEIDFQTKTKSTGVCRVAYTLNNRQPVSCTIIGQEPLFYMDYHIEDEGEEALFDAAELGILENEIQTLQREIEHFDRFAAEFSQAPEQRFDEFLEDSAAITKKRANGKAIKGETGDIAEVKTVLEQSRIGRAYLDFAAEHKVELCLSGQVADAYYDRDSGTILVNGELNFTDQVLLAARELRRHWQHRKGALIQPMLFHPDNAILVNRAQVADLVVSMIRIAWELQLGGEKRIWERIENSSMGDLGRAFAREAFNDFRTINNGQASASVFEAWFLSERCQSEDKKLIKQMLADYKGYMFDLEEAKTSITPTLIAALGEMPFGKNYLAAHTMTIMEDPIFTDVRDRSNANFLWFIKFERSFRETEQELQPGLDALAGDTRHLSSQDKNQDEHNATRKTDIPVFGGSAEIISLFPDAPADAESGDKSGKSGKRLSSKSKIKRNQSKASADIVYLRRWSGE